MNHGGGGGSSGGIDCNRRSRERERDRSRERLNGASSASSFHSHDARNDYNNERSRGNGGGQNSNTWRSVTPVFGRPGGEGGGGEAGGGEGGRRGESGSRGTPLSHRHTQGVGGGRSTPSFPGRGGGGGGGGGRITPSCLGGGRVTPNMPGYYNYKNSSSSSSSSSSSGRQGQGYSRGGVGMSRPGSSLGTMCNEGGGGGGGGGYVNGADAHSRPFSRAEGGFMYQKRVRSRSRSYGRDAGGEGGEDGRRGRDTERRRYDWRGERWRKYRSRSKVRVYERRGGGGRGGRGGEGGWSRSRSRIRSVENASWGRGGGGGGGGGLFDKRRQQQQHRPVGDYAAMAWNGGEGVRQEGWYRNGSWGEGGRDGGRGGGRDSGRKRERSEERVPSRGAAVPVARRSGRDVLEIEQGEKEWRKRHQQEKRREYDHQQQYQQQQYQQPQEGQKKRKQQQQEQQQEQQEEEEAEAARNDKKGKVSEGGSVDDDDESRDDSVGHYQGKPGDIIEGRYVVEMDVGMGTFGRVVQCLDRKRERKVALKVVRNIKRYTESAQIEADVLVDVNRRGGRGMTHCVQLFRDFVFEEHCCLVFERLGVSLYDFLKAHNYRPYPLYPHVHDFARQLLESLEFLHGMQLIHTDLKPENILLRDNAVVAKGGEVGGTEGGGSKKRVVEVPASTQVKVIDFGGATYDDDARKSTTINTRQYRGPEVILELGWSYPSDLWSAGCIVAELYTGDVLFATHNNMEHLALIERCLGPFPREMLVRSPKGVADKFFNLTPPEGKDGDWGRCRWREELDAASQRHVRRMPCLEEVFEKDKDSGIIELVRGLVEIDPRERLTATQALALPFFRGAASAGVR